jgi:UbiD family decarboxylase
MPLDSGARIYSDLRDYLRVLEEHGKLKRIARPVDKDWEIAAVGRVNFQSVPEEQRCALMFENVKGFDMPVVFGILGGSRAIYALALRANGVDDIADAWTRALHNPVPPQVVTDAPVHENVLLADVASLLKLPVPTWTVEHDPGPYLTAPFVMAADGTMAVPQGAGIGIDPLPDRLEACTLRRETIRP